MPRGRKATKNIFGDAGPNADLSPMIDLVFLLLIFFMIASKLITFKKDPRVQIPVALERQVPKLVVGRVVLNVLNDGSIVSEDGDPMTTAQVEQMMAQAKATNPETRLHLRADATATHDKVKAVMNASARGGVSEVVFSVMDR